MNGVRTVGAISLVTSYPLALVAADAGIVSGGWGFTVLYFLQAFLGIALLNSGKSAAEKTCPVDHPFGYSCERPNYHGGRHCRVNPDTGRKIEWENEDG